MIESIESNDLPPKLEDVLMLEVATGEVLRGETPSAMNIDQDLVIDIDQDSPAASSSAPNVELPRPLKFFHIDEGTPTERCVFCALHAFLPGKFVRGHTFLCPSIAHACSLPPSSFSL
jgi:hypothetical protein